MARLQCVRVFLVQVSASETKWASQAFSVAVAQNAAVHPEGAASCPTSGHLCKLHSWNQIILGIVCSFVALFSCLLVLSFTEYYAHFPLECTRH